MRIHRHLLRRPETGEDGGSEGGGAAAVAATPAAASTPAAAPSAQVAGTPATAATPAAGTPAPPPEEAKPAWPEDWRTQLAGGDEKTLKQLQRYASPNEVWNKTRELEKRLSSGELRPVLPKNATPEQIAEWRTANGVPDAPNKYDLGTAKVSEAGQAFLDKFLPIAHATNQTPEQVKANLQFIGKMNQDAAEAQSLRDHELQSQYEEDLRAEWGTEFKRNIGFIHNTLDGAASPEFRNKLLGARLADGTPVGSSPDMLKFLLRVALKDKARPRWRAAGPS
jgi:hypothetical protein